MTLSERQILLSIKRDEGKLSFRYVCKTFGHNRITDLIDRGFLSVGPQDKLYLTSWAETQLS